MIHIKQISNREEKTFLASKKDGSLYPLVDQNYTKENYKCLI